MIIGNDQVKGIEYLVSIVKDNVEFRFGKSLSDDEWKEVYDRIGESDDIMNSLSHHLLELVNDEIEEMRKENK